MRGAVLILDKEGLREKKVITDNTNDERSTLPERTAVVKGMQLRVKIRKENPNGTRKRRQTHCSSKSANTLFTVIVRSSRQKISKDRVHPNNTISHRALTDVYGSPYPATE